MLNKTDFASLPLQVGDIVFTLIPVWLFKTIAEDSLCWSNHVSLITGFENGEWQIAEAIVPQSRTTTLTKIVSRSSKKHFAIRRLKDISVMKESELLAETERRIGVPYDLKFNFHSKKTYCSKFIYEIYRDVLGVEVGKIETFKQLLDKNPKAHMWIWRLWFLGRIPWNEETITPASLWESDMLETIYDNNPELSILR